MISGFNPQHAFRIAVIASLVTLAQAEQAMIPLAGEWKFALDEKNVGVDEKWFARTLEDTVELPGTTDENHKGKRIDEAAVDRLSRIWFWKGPAWYQREVTIPETWKDKRITLFFERGKNTRVWVDQTFCGREDTLSAPQIFDVTKAMTPGKHTITALVDNSKLPPVGPAHAVDERTQTNWNGIIGKMELRATDHAWIEDVQVYPNAAKKEASVRVVIGNMTGKAVSGTIAVACESYNTDKPAVFKTQSVDFTASDARSTIEFVYRPGDDVPLWDEFRPAMLRLALKLEAKADGRTLRDERSASFGMRDFTRDGSRLLVNGRQIFLRGRLDCANYPLTGYPPMDKKSWQRVLGILKAWGLNHVRFHSWCPPQAAFEVADELGFYFQAELPNKRSAFKAPDDAEAAKWNIDHLVVETAEKDVSLYDYCKREGALIQRHFGNHPSHAMFTLGNELGRVPAMAELVSSFRMNDARRLYAQGANNVHWAPSLAEGDDFWVTGKVEKGAKPIRASFSIFDFPNIPIETNPPSTMADFSKSIEGIPVPMIGHEVGEYQVYPDFRDIPKFTGVTRAKNFEIFRERLTKAGMLDQAHDFVRASGALSAICYREDMEMAFRTPGFGGFQLLDIQDFPGQGTAIIGMLNDLMESKGIIEPEQWRQFCSETVPLLRMEKYTWTSDEVFTGKVQIAHYGKDDMPDAKIIITLDDAVLARDAYVARFDFPAITLKKGGITDVGTYSLPLASTKIATPRKLDLTIAIAGTSYRNTYPIWVYPRELDNKVPEGVLVTDSYSAAATQKHLASGGKVLLLPKPDKLPDSIQGAFMTDFWSPMFAESAKKRGGPIPAGTLGFLCDPKHPALANFPTEFHSNWQWWHLVKNSRAINYDGTPSTYRPIVQVIDNFVRNHKLGLIAEMKVGKGALLICSIDLSSHQDKPEARQLLHSLLRYAGSPGFSPKTEIDAALLEKRLP